MESKSLLFLFVLVIAIPIFALSSNHELFFGIASLVVIIISVRNIVRLAADKSLEDDEPDEETVEELEDMMDIDAKKFGRGVSIICNMLIILLLIYSSFFLAALYMKIICALAILLQIHFIFKKAGKDGSSFSPDRHKIQILMSSILNITVIIFALLNKLAKLK